MTEFRRPFGPDELPEAETGAGGGEPASDVARALATGREIDSFASRDVTLPSAEFTDRVMAAIAAEPTPRPVAAAGRALGQGRVVALLASVADMWRVAFSGGRPFAVRAQALAVVAVVVIALGSLGGAAVVGALGLLSDAPAPSPTESVSPSGSPSPSESPSATPSESPSSSPSDSPSPSASPSGSPTASPTDTAEPTETASPTGTDDSDDRTPRPGETEKPSDTPDPTGED